MGTETQMISILLVVTYLNKGELGFGIRQSISGAHALDFYCCFLSRILNYAMLLFHISVFFLFLKKVFFFF